MAMDENYNSGLVKKNSIFWPKKGLVKGHALSKGNKNFDKQSQILLFLVILKSISSFFQLKWTYYELPYTLKAIFLF